MVLSVSGLIPGASNNTSPTKASKVLLSQAVSPVDPIKVNLLALHNCLFYRLFLCMSITETSATSPYGGGGILF